MDGVNSEKSGMGRDQSEWSTTGLWLAVKHDGQSVASSLMLC